MANSRVKAAGWSTGERLTSAQATSLDIGQYRAITRTGNNDLLATTTITGAGYQLLLDFSDNAASQLEIDIGDQDANLVSNGAGSYRFSDADKVYFGGASAWPTLASHTLTDYAPSFSPVADTASWDFNVLGYGILATTVNTYASVTLVLGSLPRGMVITGIKVEVKGATSGTLPGTMPSVSFARFAAGAYGTPTEVITTQTDTSASNAAYTVDHTITKTGLSHTVVSDSLYIINVAAGYGGGAATGFRVYRCYITGTLNKLRTA